MTRWLVLGTLCFLAVLAAGAVIALASAIGGYLGTKIGGKTVSLTRLVDKRTGTAARCEFYAARLDHPAGQEPLTASERDSLVLTLTDAARELRDLEAAIHGVHDETGRMIGVVVRSLSGHWIGCCGEFIRGPKRNRLDAEEAVREAARIARGVTS